MKLQFDANQQFQLDAVAAVTDLFDGQPQGAPEFAVIKMGADGGPVRRAGPHRAGRRQPAAACRGQASRRTPAPFRRATTSKWPTRPQPLEAWELFDAPANQSPRLPALLGRDGDRHGQDLRLPAHHLRAVAALRLPEVHHRRAERRHPRGRAEEHRDHRRALPALYNNLPFEHFVYDAKKVNRLRQFATSNTLQILVINIDAFRKNFTGTEEEQKSNVIYKESDKLSGRQPIEFVQAARPIVIIDEPQSVDSTDKAQEAIKALNPLCTLRYSATHRNPYNLVYRLDPVRAFELRLVKQIVVASATAEGAPTTPSFASSRSTTRRASRPSSASTCRQPEGRRRSRSRSRTAQTCSRSPTSGRATRNGFVGGRDQRRAGQRVSSASPTAARCGWARRSAACARTSGALRSSTRSRSTWRRSCRCASAASRCFSLFFIDRVANYRDYDDAGQPVKGKFAEAFEAELAELAQRPSATGNSTG